MVEILKYKNPRNDRLMEEYDKLLEERILVDEQLDAMQFQLELVTKNTSDKNATSKMIDKALLLIGKSEALNLKIHDALREMGKYTDEDELDIAKMWKKAQAETAGFRIVE